MSADTIEMLERAKYAGNRQSNRLSACCLRAVCMIIACRKGSMIRIEFVGLGHQDHTQIFINIVTVIESGLTKKNKDTSDVQ